MSEPNETSVKENRFKYWAFISYSHQDNLAVRGDGSRDHLQWANWLQNAIETYRLPGRYRDRATPAGEPMPERFVPIFRDEAEMPTGHDLGGQIRDALESSRYLIVIASPNSARSTYVNEEVRYFRALGRGHRIFTLIVAGEPNVRLRPKAGWSAAAECFCPALVHPLRADGSVDETALLPEEPVAADVRVKQTEPARELRASERSRSENRDGLHLAKLKLVAGLMGIGLDELIQRDARRRLRQLQITVVTVAAVLLALVGLGSYAFWAAAQAKVARQQRQAAANQRLYQKYISDLQSAHGLWRQGEFEKLTAMLAEYEKPAEYDPRGFEWYYWRGVCQPRPVCEFTTTNANFTALAFDPSGLRLAGIEHGKTIAGIDNGKIVVWDVKAARELYRLDDQAATAVFTQDGKTLISIPDTALPGRVKLYNADDGKDLGNLGWTTCVALYPDGKGYALAGDQGSILLFKSLQAEVANRDLTVGAGRASPGSRIRNSGQYGSICDMAFDPTGACIAVGYADGSVLIWSVASCSILSRGPVAHPGPILGLSFSPDGKLVASQSAGKLERDRQRLTPGEAKVWVAATGKVLSQVPLRRSGEEFVNVHPVRVRQGATRPVFSADGTRWFVADDDGVQVWDVQSSTRLYTLHRGNDPVVSVAVSGAGALLASADKNKVRVSTVANPATGIVARNQGFIRGIALSPDGNHIAGVCDLSQTGDFILQAWHRDSGNVILQTSSVGAYQKHPWFEPNGTAIGCGAYEFCLATNLMLPVTPGTNWVRVTPPALPFPRDQPITYRDQIRDKDVFAEYSTEARRSPDGSAVVRVEKANTHKWGQDGGVRVTHRRRVVLMRANGEARTNLFEAAESAVSLMAISPDSKWVVVAGDEGTPRLWSLRDGSPGVTFKERHANSVTALAFSADGSLLATGGDDRSIIVWDVRTGARRFTFSGHRREISSLAFFPDGRRLVSGSGLLESNNIELGDVRLWDLTTGVGCGELPLEGAQTVGGVIVSSDGTRVYASVNDTRTFVTEKPDSHSNLKMDPPWTGKIISWDGSTQPR